jgi:hypothetical protein
VSAAENAVTTADRGTSLYGLLAEFETADALLAAASAVRDKGYTHWDTHVPFVVHGLDEAMGIRPTKLPLVVAGAGVTGTAAGLLLEWWTNAVDYPFIISGKPFFGLPAAIPVAFETTILFAAISALVGMLAFNGLPQLYHPLFKSRAFRRATADRFFVSVEAEDPLFDPAADRIFLESLGAVRVEEVAL